VFTLSAVSRQPRWWKRPPSRIVAGDNVSIFTLNDLGELSRRFADNIADIFRCLPVCGFEKIERNCSQIGRLEG